jgi:hypothetical protein
VAAQLVASRVVLNCTELVMSKLQFLNFAAVSELVS